MQQHLPVKSNLLDSSGSETTTTHQRQVQFQLQLGFGIGGGGGGNEQPLCPKPRRLGLPIPEFLKPLRCAKHSQQNGDGRSGVLNMIGEKIIDGRETSECSGCCYGVAGSPPGRTGNPLVNDVQFIHQMDILSPFTRTKLSDKFGIASASPSPVRFEIN